MWGGSDPQEQLEEEASPHRQGFDWKRQWYPVAAMRDLEAMDPRQPYSVKVWTSLLFFTRDSESSFACTQVDGGACPGYSSLEFGVILDENIPLHSSHGFDESPMNTISKHRMNCVRGMV